MVYQILRLLLPVTTAESNQPVSNCFYFFRYDNLKNPKKNESKFESSFADGKAVFKIKKASLDNNGTYYVLGKSSRSVPTRNCPKKKIYELHLQVLGMFYY